MAIEIRVESSWGTDDGEGRIALSARSAVDISGTTRRAEALALLEAPAT